MLDAVRLEQLEDELRTELEEHGTEILTRLNATGRLKELLDLLGLENLLEPETGFHAYPTGKIVVIGQSSVKVDVLLGIAKKLGIEKDRFEFYLEYKDAKRINFKNMRWTPSYCVVLAGPMPHSGMSKGDFGSIISAIEHKDGYPLVVRMGPPDRLKITKTDFKEKLQELIHDGTVRID